MFSFQNYKEPENDTIGKHCSGRIKENAGNKHLSFLHYLNQIQYFDSERVRATNLAWADIVMGRQVFDPKCSVINGACASCYSSFTESRSYKSVKNAFYQHECYRSMKNVQNSLSLHPTTQNLIILTLSQTTNFRLFQT